MFKNWTAIHPEKIDDVTNPLITIGCMTGTSADSKADFTLAVFDLDGLPIAYQNMVDVIPSALRVQLSTLSKTNADHVTVEERSQVEAKLTEYLADAFLRVIYDAGLSDYPKTHIILSPHGQAINHQPLASPPFTDVLMNGDRLAELTGYPVISRHRQKPLVVSMAAPLAPVLIRELFDNKMNRVLLNGGGIANICVLLKDQSELIGYDTGPANGPIDALIEYCIERASDKIPEDLSEAISQAAYDVGGQFAARGQVLEPLKQVLLNHDYFKRDIAKKSANRAAFDLFWIFEFTKDKDYLFADIVATVSEVVAVSITEAITATISEGQTPTEIITYGGLSHNRHVMQRIEALLSDTGQFTFTPMSDYRYDPDFFESLLMAYLGHCAIHGVKIDLSYCAREGCENPTAIPGSLSLPSSIALLEFSEVVQSAHNDLENTGASVESSNKNGAVSAIVSSSR